MEVAAVPVSQLKASEWNPRTLLDERFKNLCASIKADPDFMQQRPVLAMADGVIYAGAMRYRAAVHLGWKDVPAILADIPEQLAKERALKDNQNWGSWQEDQLAELLYGLQESGSAVDLLGFDSAELDRLLASVSGVDFPELPTGDRGPMRQMVFTVTEEQQASVEDALRKAKALSPFVDTDNENSNGNALARVCESFLG